MRRPLSFVAAWATSALLATAATPPTSPETTLDGLLASFARLPGLSAKFREEKRIALLAEPLVSEGVLYFAPPSRLARHTTTPSRTSVLVVGDQLSFGDAESHEDIDLNANPVVRLFIDSFLDLLRGDRHALEQSYAITFTPRAGPAPQSWELALTPRRAPVSEAIRRLELSGTGVVLDRIRIVETSNDESVTVFSEVDTDRRFTGDELRRFFVLSPR